MQIKYASFDACSRCNRRDIYDTEVGDVTHSNLFFQKNRRDIYDKEVGDVTDSNEHLRVLAGQGSFRLHLPPLLTRTSLSLSLSLSL